MTLVTIQNHNKVISLSTGSFSWSLKFALFVRIIAIKVASTIAVSFKLRNYAILTDMNEMGSK